MADAKIEIKVGALYAKEGLLVADIDLPAATGVLQRAANTRRLGLRRRQILAIAPTRGKSAAWRCLLVRAG
jgi:hypothetical protein